jgi:hypothetical protein
VKIERLLLQLFLLLEKLLRLRQRATAEPGETPEQQRDLDRDRSEGEPLRKVLRRNKERCQADGYETDCAEPEGTAQERKDLLPPDKQLSCWFRDT